MPKVFPVPTALMRTGRNRGKSWKKGVITVGYCPCCGKRKKQKAKGGYVMVGELHKIPCHPRR
ncbi:MAG: hypothetical protein HY228_02165 [Candidatus Yonathbacteria bacterium]|nr:hypothetical protein [Candidatus Yonathbacteria bacterium]